MSKEWTEAEAYAVFGLEAPEEPKQETAEPEKGEKEQEVGWM